MISRVDRALAWPLSIEPLLDHVWNQSYGPKASFYPQNQKMHESPNLPPPPLLPFWKKQGKKCSRSPRVPESNWKVHNYSPTNILNAVAHLQFEVCKSSQDLFKHPTNKIIIITFRTTSKPFQHEVCQTIKDQMIS